MFYRPKMRLIKRSGCPFCSTPKIERLIKPSQITANQPMLTRVSQNCKEPWCPLSEASPAMIGAVIADRKMVRRPPDFMSLYNLDRILRYDNEVVIRIKSLNEGFSLFQLRTRKKADMYYFLHCCILQNNRSLQC